MEISWVGYSLQVSAVYAKCTRVGRRSLWQAMEDVRERFPGPWLMAGDFTVVSNASERFGGAPPNRRNMDDFNEAIFSCGLVDGPLFSWTNGRQCLDRAIANTAWMDTFDVTKVSHLVRGRSDHAPLFVKCGLHKAHSSSFRFLNVWTKHSSFMGVVRDAWQVPVHAGGMLGFYQRLSNVKSKLRGWSRQSFGDIFQAVHVAEENLLYHQEMFDATRDDISRMQLGEAQLEDEEEIRVSTVQYFEKLLTSDREDRTTPSLDFPLPSLTDEDNLMFQQLPFLQDVKEEFFKGAPQPRGFSSALIVLIPKVPGVTKWQEFRPISLCNQSSKIISKVLTNRLNLLLPKLISPWQSGFVPGRSIADNILVAQKLALDIDRKLRCPNLMLKLDMEKAYDRDSSNPLGGFDKATRSLHCQDESHFFISPGLRVPYLAFADDTLVFTRCSEEGLASLKTFFDSYQAFSVLLKLGKLCNAFLWDKPTGVRGIHWTSWGKICYPVSEGGLGFRSFEDMSSAFAGKLWWRLRKNESLWAHFMQAKYVRGKHPLQVQVVRPSAAWRRLEGIRRVAESHIRWCVGKGFVDLWGCNVARLEQWVPAQLVNQIQNSAQTQHLATRRAPLDKHSATEVIILRMEGFT
ncbi:uncharacterized protein [Coffea arabica]|uniref:Reverse transcriptase domain-containing protein n=1 Tax=Coffea arabica TaxID=13443 RepID=A0A6P6TW89_COFAR|nr:uncharacterized protein LOC113704947 [Coffea arabica]